MSGQQRGWMPLTGSLARCVSAQHGSGKVRCKERVLSAVPTAVFRCPRNRRRINEAETDDWIYVIWKCY